MYNIIIEELNSCLRSAPYVSLLGVIVTAFCIFSTLQYVRNKWKISPSNGMKLVPVVPGSIPIFGHYFKMAADFEGFIKLAYKNYGSVFQINFLGRKMVLLCDKALKKEYYATPEEKLSSFDFVLDTYVFDALVDDPHIIIHAMPILKKFLTVNSSTFLPKMHSKAQQMVELIKQKSHSNGVTQKILEEALNWFVIDSTMDCYLCMELTTDVFTKLRRLSKLIMYANSATMFVPKRLVRCILHGTIARLRNSIVLNFKSEIEDYRNNLKKVDSRILREAADYKNSLTNKVLTDYEVGCFIVALLIISTDNTPSLLLHSILDIASHPTHWGIVKNLAETDSDHSSSDGLYSEYLSACVMESARLNSQLFAAIRKPRGFGFTLGGYDMSRVYAVALSATGNMVYGSGDEEFVKPEKYNPKRFIGDRAESYSSQHVLAWSAGSHSCPGKNFAVMIAKVGLSCICQNFERILKREDLPKLNYISAYAFGTRTCGSNLIILK